VVRSLFTAWACKLFQRTPHPTDGAGTGPLDLSESLDFTLTLLGSTTWRQRLVERIELASSTHARATSIYQIDFPPETIEDFFPAATGQVNVILPLTTRPKRPLLRFQIDGPQGASASLLSRTSIAEIEEEYLEVLLKRADLVGLLAGGLPRDLLKAICQFTPGVYDSVRTTRDRAADLAGYLDTQLSFPVTPSNVKAWLGPSDAAARILVPALGEPPEKRSSSECVLLALPVMESPPASAIEVATIVESYHVALQSIAEREDVAADTDEAEAGREFLSVLAEYGRRWELLVEVEVPLHKPAQLRVVEDRPLGLESGGWARQLVAFGDAASAHVEISVFDPNVAVVDYEVRNLVGECVGFPPLEAARKTDDVLSIYSSDRTRPYFAYFRVRLRTARYVRWTAVATCLVTSSAAAAAAVVEVDSEFVEKLTLLTLPATIAATVMLAREATTLATHLIRGLRFALAVSLLVLWLVVLVRISRQGIDAGWLEDVRDSVEDVLEWWKLPL
jgi:hypothetical protein